MGRRQLRQPAGRNRKWRWAGLGALVLLAIGMGMGMVWSRRDGSEPSSGGPRLVVDRTDVDLGYQRYGAMAAVSFTLSNGGEGVLRVEGVPPVIAKAGC